MRGVFDTSVLISYLLTHRPPIATLVNHDLARGVILMVTASELLAELHRVLAYPRLQRYYTDGQRECFVAMVMALSEIVDLPETIPQICRDPNDDMFIACAVVGGADVIVSGDNDLLTLKHVGDIAILSPGALLERLKSEEN